MNHPQSVLTNVLRPSVELTAQSGPDNKLVGPLRARSERWLKLTSKATFLFSLTKCAALLANAQRLIKNE